MPEATALLGSVTPAEFLRSYWQRQPLLVRGAVPNYESPLSADELAGLALDADVEGTGPLMPLLSKRFRSPAGPFWCKR